MEHSHVLQVLTEPEWGPLNFAHVFYLILGMVLCIWLRAARDYFCANGLTCPLSPAWVYIRARFCALVHWLHIGWTHVLLERDNTCGAEWKPTGGEYQGVILGLCARSPKHRGRHRTAGGDWF